MTTLPSLFAPAVPLGDSTSIVDGFNLSGTLSLTFPAVVALSLLWLAFSLNAIWGGDSETIRRGQRQLKGLLIVCSLLAVALGGLAIAISYDIVAMKPSARATPGVAAVAAGVIALLSLVALSEAKRAAGRFDQTGGEPDPNDSTEPADAKRAAQGRSRRGQSRSPGGPLAAFVSAWVVVAVALLPSTRGGSDVELPTTRFLTVERFDEDNGGRTALVTAPRLESHLLDYLVESQEAPASRVRLLLTHESDANGQWTGSQEVHWTDEAETTTDFGELVTDHLAIDDGTFVAYSRQYGTPNEAVLEALRLPLSTPFTFSRELVVGGAARVGPHDAQPRRLLAIAGASTQLDGHLDHTIFVGADSNQLVESLTPRQLAARVLALESVIERVVIQSRPVESEGRRLGIVYQALVAYDGETLRHDLYALEQGDSASESRDTPRRVVLFAVAALTLVFGVVSWLQTRGQSQPSPSAGETARAYPSYRRWLATAAVVGGGLLIVFA